MNDFRISGIKDFSYNMTSLDVAKEISKILEEHGRGFVNLISPIEIVKSCRRFYVLWQQIGSLEPIFIGTVAVNVSNGEISALCIKSKYRKMGLARKLIQFCIEAIRKEGGTNVIRAYVREKNNEALHLFISIGFKVTGKDDSAFELKLIEPKV